MTDRENIPKTAMAQPFASYTPDPAPPLGVQWRGDNLQEILNYIGDPTRYNVENTTEVILTIDGEPTKLGDWIFRLNGNTIVTTDTRWQTIQPLLAKNKALQFELDWNTSLIAAQCMTRGRVGRPRKEPDGQP